jgi:hypothetical protein
MKENIDSDLQLAASFSQLFCLSLENIPVLKLHSDPRTYQDSRDWLRYWLLLFRPWIVGHMQARCKGYRKQSKQISLRRTNETEAKNSSKYQQMDCRKKHRESMTPCSVACSIAKKKPRKLTRCVRLIITDQTSTSKQCVETTKKSPPSPNPRPPNDQPGARAQQSRRSRSAAKIRQNSRQKQRQKQQSSEERSLLPQSVPARQVRRTMDCRSNSTRDDQVFAAIQESSFAFTNGFALREERLVSCYFGFGSGTGVAE